eukprot:m.8272 g.8272  ORF g.8272 m.8272 type:complete len:630 (+) comp5339_c0_seq2:127-2016(+)
MSDYTSVYVGQNPRRKPVARPSNLRRLNPKHILMSVAVLGLLLWVLFSGNSPANGHNALPYGALPPDLRAQAYMSDRELLHNQPPEEFPEVRQQDHPSVHESSNGLHGASDQAQLEQEKQLKEKEEAVRRQIEKLKAQLQQKQQQEQQSLQQQQQQVQSQPQAQESQLHSASKGQYFVKAEDMNERQKAVVATFNWAWKGYKEHAWGHDELLPVSRKSSEWFHLGLTLIDALDTMYLMGLHDDFKEARDWVETSLNFDQNQDVNLFECTIRVLGGLLSTYSLTKDKMFLEKATDLGDRLIHGFNDQSGVPFSDVNLLTKVAHKPKWGPDSSTAEISTIQLEFKYLSYLTKDKRYFDKATQVMEHLHSLPKKDGLVPIFINANSGRFSGSTITLGARGDSYYEYLLKQWLLTNKRETVYKEMYLEAVDGIEKHLLKRSPRDHLLYVAELINQRSSPKMDHLVCFLPGLLALGASAGMPSHHMDLAKDLTKTCYEMYARQPAKLAPEIVHFHTDGTDHDMYVKPADAHNLLRPETVESLYIMYRLTNDKLYQEWGWNIYQAFEKHCRVGTGGYSSLNSVLSEHPTFRDKMESFFLGETLKYLFLLFTEEDLIPHSQWVFNTEAHPLPVFDI